MIFFFFVMFQSRCGYFPSVRFFHSTWKGLAPFFRGRTSTSSSTTMRIMSDDDKYLWVYYLMTYDAILLPTQRSVSRKQSPDRMPVTCSKPERLLTREERFSFLKNQKIQFSVSPYLSNYFSRRRFQSRVIYWKIFW